MEMNSDELWRAAIMASFGCTPAYWDTFRINSATSSKLRACRYEEYRNLSQYINGLESFPRHYRNMSRHIIKSCTEMKRKVSVETKDIIWNKARKNSYLSLMFRYDEDHYMEVKNTKDFEGESLLSQVGGFIGKY